MKRGSFFVLLLALLSFVGCSEAMLRGYSKGLKMECYDEDIGSYYDYDVNGNEIWIPENIVRKCE